MVARQKDDASHSDAIKIDGMGRVESSVSQRIFRNGGIHAEIFDDLQCENHQGRLEKPDPYGRYIGQAVISERRPNNVEIEQADARPKCYPTSQTSFPLFNRLQMVLISHRRCISRHAPQ